MKPYIAGLGLALFVSLVPTKPTPVVEISQDVYATKLQDKIEGRSFKTEKRAGLKPEKQGTVRATVSGNKQSWLQASGIDKKEWALVDMIISKESGWRYDVWNGTGSGAYGLCQSLPANKMASAGSDYMTNPVTQLRWCDSYAQARYGGWAGAWEFWQSNNWW